MSSLSIYVWSIDRRYVFVSLSIVLSIVGSIVLCLIAYFLWYYCFRADRDDDSKTNANKGTTQRTSPSPSPSPPPPPQQQPNVFTLQQGRGMATQPAAYILDPAYAQDSWSRFDDDNFVVLDNPSYFREQAYTRPSPNLGGYDPYARGPYFRNDGLGRTGGGSQWDDGSNSSLSPDGAWFWESETYA